jgi:hypothetical protein
MNADASATVAVDVDAGLRTGVLLPIGLGIAGAGVVVAVLARALLADFLAERIEDSWADEPPRGRRPRRDRHVTA